MKNSALLLLTFLTLPLSAAVEFTSGIHSISPPGEDQQSVIRFTNGRVAIVDERIAEDLRARDAGEPVHHYNAKLGKNSELLAIESIDVLSVPEIPKPVTRESFEPTVLESEAKALRIMKSFRNPRPVQWTLECFNMAEVRAYEAFRDFGLKSQKIFLFFTDKYIREYGYKWWFHVTPMTYVQTPTGPQARVLDPEWRDGPVGIKTWTDSFMKNKVSCARIDRYSAYSEHEKDNYCYIFPVSMYYYIPDNLEEMEKTGDIRTDFVMSEYHWAIHDDF